RAASCEQDRLANSSKLSARGLLTSAPPFPPLPAPAPSCAQFPSNASASAWRGAGSLPVEPRRLRALRSSHRARRTSWPSRRRERTKGAPSAGPPAPQSSYSCGSTPRSRSILCAFRPLAFPPLLLLPCGGALAGNGLHPGNVLAQAADLLQTL